MTDASAAVPADGADRPRWRVRVGGVTLWLAFAVWAVVVVAFGAVVLIVLAASLDRAVSGPVGDWGGLVAWAVPTLVVTGWVLRGAGPAVRDSDQDWLVYATRRLIVGNGGRPRAVAVLIALVLGGPVGTAWIVLGLLELASAFG